jgi:hypothetical protein
MIHIEHPIVNFLAMVESGAKAEKLKEFKDRVSKNHVVAFFKSPEDLRAHILHALPETIKELPGD